MRIFTNVIDALTNLGAWLSGLALAVIVSSFWIEVVSRYFFNAPTSWTATISLYLLLVMVMLMLPWLTREGRHVTMTLVFERTPARVAPQIARGMSALSCAICLAAAYFCSVETLRQYVSDVRSPDALMLPMWGLNAMLVYGFVLSAAHFVRHAWTGFIPSHWEG